MKKRIILKIGSSTLTKGTNHISRGKIEDLARQILALREKYDFILVSSGAVATAKQFVQLAGGNPIEVKQALAAIGQPVLMKIYQEIFYDFGLKVAQCLLNYRDFDNENSKTNTINTVNVLLENNYIPIFNENDTVATEEIKFGDNDKLGAMTANLLTANLLILASDIDGLFDDDPKQNPNCQLIEIVQNLENVKSLAVDSLSAHGTGGMKSKLAAAEICQKAGVEMWIVNGGKENFMVDAMHGIIPFTKFLV
ncbi:MAG: glutamate 5-kinase [Paraglaciecola sp.]|jgi:glutamate 5-kinase